MSKPAPIVAREPSAEIVNVTPAQAKKWLGQNGHNRYLRERDVRSYARDMMNGRWRLTMEAIKFDPEGTLLDGQHRLEAILQANTPIPMLVAWDVDPAAQESMDSGIKRSTGDVLRLRGQVNVNNLGAVASRVLQWQTGTRWSRNRELKLSKAEVIEAIEFDPTIALAANKAVAHRKRILAPVSAVGLCYWIFARIDEEQAGEFMDMVAYGDGLATGHPALTLRNKLVQIRATQGTWLATERYIALFCRSWNAYREGRTMHKLAVATGKSGAKGEEVFPEPK